MPESAGFFVPLLATLLIVLLYRALQIKKPPAPYPPGPPPKPIIGNAFDIPRKKAWLKYKEWSNTFNSDIIHLSAMNMHIVIVNSMDDAVELLERRSAVYSSRPSVPFYKLLGIENMTPILPYGTILRKHRRFMDEGLRRDILPLYHYIFLEKVHLMLGQLLREPEKFKHHCASLSASTTMALAFGYDVIPDQKDHFVEPAEFGVNTAAELAIPGRTLLVPFGFLGHIPPWFPGASTQRLCAKVREAFKQSREGPFQYVKQELAAGKAKDSVLKTLLDQHSKEDGQYQDEEILKDIMATFFVAGVETMQVAQTNFILAMTLHPDTQRKAQEEIDRVIGSERLPTFNDRTSLPYVEALYREVRRWRLVAPTGMPHSTESDDVYKGFYIPKGSLIVPNVWAITRNEERYPDPESFQPERFFKADGTLNDDTISYSFGFGRRICPGRYMADNIVWLMVVSVLAAFNISKAKDQNGDEIDVDADAFTDGFTSHPMPFKCSIVPRTAQAESMIQSSAEVAWDNLTKAS